MYAINAVFDGTSFKPKEPIPVNEEYEVVITFTTPVKSTETSRRHFSKAEKDKIINSLFGALPSTIDLDEAKDI